MLRASPAEQTAAAPRKLARRRQSGGPGHEFAEAVRTSAPMRRKLASGFRRLIEEPLSRRETHEFLTAPQGMTFAQTLSYAIARSYTEDAGLARRIAASKLALADLRAQPFWREPTRFFARHAAPREAIDDLCG